MNNLNTKTQTSEPLFYWKSYKIRDKTFIRACTKIKTVSGDEEIAICKPFEFQPVNLFNVGGSATHNLKKISRKFGFQIVVQR